MDERVPLLSREKTARRVKNRVLIGTAITVVVVLVVSMTRQVERLSLYQKQVSSDLALDPQVYFRKFIPDS